MLDVPQDEVSGRIDAPPDYLCGLQGKLVQFSRP